MSVKFRVNSGKFEVEFEGDDELFKSDVLPMLTRLIENQSVQKDDEEVLPTDPSGSETAKADAVPPKRGTYTVGNIASKLVVKSGTDLVIAACAFIHFMEVKEDLSRSQILQTMQQAKSYYKTNMSSNLSRYLQTLVNAGKLNEVKKDVYSLTTSMIRELEGKIG